MLSIILACVSKRCECARSSSHFATLENLIMRSSCVETVRKWDHPLRFSGARIFYFTVADKWMGCAHAISYAAAAMGKAVSGEKEILRFALLFLSKIAFIWNGRFFLMTRETIKKLRHLTLGAGEIYVCASDS